MKMLISIILALAGHGGEVSMPHGQTAEVTEGTVPYERVLVWVHGGGWAGGEPGIDTNFDETARSLHAAGWTIVAPTYRLSGDTEWPAQAHDIFATIEWASKVQLAAGLPIHVAVGGYSAGGHIASVVGTAWNTPLNPYARVKPTVVINMAGPLDPLNWITWPGQSVSVPGVTQLVGNSRDSLRPADYADSNDPPQVVSWSTNDPIVPYRSQESAMVELAMRVPVTLVPSRGDHALGNNTQRAVAALVNEGG